MDHRSNAARGPPSPYSVGVSCSGRKIGSTKSVACPDEIRRRIWFRELRISDMADRNRGHRPSCLLVVTVRPSLTQDHVTGLKNWT